MTFTVQLRIGAAMLVLWMPCSSALSQSGANLEIARNQRQFQERFRRPTLGPADKKSDTVAARSALRALVGFHIGNAAGRFDLKGVRIPMPVARSPDNLCIRVSTADERYFAENPYKRTATGSTFGIDAPTRYRGELATTYQASEMIVLATLADNCVSRASATLVPVIPPGATTAGALIAYMNVPNDRVIGRLLASDGRLLNSASCKNAPKRIVLYTAVCQLTRPANSPAPMILEIVSRSGNAPLRYTVYVPPATPAASR